MELWSKVSVKCKCRICHGTQHNANKSWFCTSNILRLENVSQFSVFGMKLDPILGCTSEGTGFGGPKFEAFLQSFIKIWTGIVSVEHREQIAEGENELF